MCLFWDLAVVCGHDRQQQLILRKFSGLKSECLLITSGIMSARLGLMVVMIVAESIMKEKERYHTIP